MKSLIKGYEREKKWLGNAVVAGGTPGRNPR
jgi:hypothetical protein